MPIQVLFVHHFGQFGGGETALLDLLAEFNKEKIQPILLCPSGPVLQAARDLGIESYPLNVPWRLNRFSKSDPFPIKVFRKLIDFATEIYDQINISRQIITQINHVSADILHAFTQYDSISVMLAAKRCRKPYIITIHSQYAVTSERKWAFHWAFRVVSVSDWVMRSTLRRVNVYEKSRVIGVGVNTKIFNAASSHNKIREEFGIPCNSVVIGMVGRMIGWKRQDILIKAAPEVLRLYKNVYFLFIGGGSDYWDASGVNYFASLQRTVARLDLDRRVVFAGERRDMAACYAAMNIVVSAASQETFGRAVAEAMAMEKPVVCADAGAISELVNDGNTGLLVPYGDEHALAKAICELLADSDRAAMLGKHAGQYIKGHHAMDAVAEEYAKLYEAARLYN